MIGSLIGKVGTAILSEAVIKAVLLALGDWLVRKSSNELDDTLWTEVKKALKD